MYLHSLKIGDLLLENNILLAPMAGISDLSFRKITKEFNPGLVITEMVSAKALYYNDEKTKRIINLSGEKRPVAIQIFGSDLESMGYAAKYVSEFADIVDINMGCPAPKITKNGDGAKLLTDLKKAGEIVKVVVENSSKPVTLKIRSGWNKNSIVGVEIARIAEKMGASAITIHARTKQEYYAGRSDLKIIKRIKDAVNIPVIGNGDIVDEESALNMFEKTGVDGIMIGRCAIGNPWIFQKVQHFLKTGEYLENPSIDERYDLIKKHLDLVLEEKGEDVGIKEFRKYMGYYTKGLPASSDFRAKINFMDNKDDVIFELKSYFKSIRSK